MHLGLKEFFLSPNGRTSRAGMWVFFGIYALMMVLAGLSDKAFGFWDNSSATGSINTVIGLVLIWPSTVIAMKRLHDRSIYGWWLLIMLGVILIPYLVVYMLATIFDITTGLILGLGIANAVMNLVTLVLFVILMVLPGIKGPNKYGLSLIHI